MRRETRVGRAETPDPGRKNIMTGCVIANGEIRDAARARDRVRRFDLVIAADGGADYLNAWGITPHVIIGDMDSLNPEAWSNDAGIEFIRHPEEKDKTDAELALDLALERGCVRVSFFGALGGRLGHTLGNIALAARHPGRVEIVSEASILTAVDGSTPLSFRGEPGSLVSMIPFPRAENVRTDGLKYPLENDTLSAGTRGISNVLTHGSGWIRIGGGLLLVDVEDRKPE